MDAPVLVSCPGCGGRYPAEDGPQHPYMIGSAGCWARYGAVLGREYEEPALFADVHRLTVDAYAAQHPGDPTDRRAVQSAWIHFAALDAMFRHGRSHDEARALLGRLAGHVFPPLPAAPLPWPITAADVAAAALEQHRGLVEEWARVTHAGWLGVIGAVQADMFSLA